MDDKQLAKKFHDKKFLKSNEFANLAAKLFNIVKENKFFFILGIIVAIALSVSIYGLKYYHLKQVESFSQKFYLAQKSLKKESLYRGLINEYKDLPGSQFVRLKLIDDLLDHNQTQEAQKVIEQGLQNNDKDIFTTLLVLKNINILKEENKYQQAAEYAIKQENKVLSTYYGHYQLIVAELYLLSDNNGDARKIYEKISAFVPLKNSGQKIVNQFDPAVINQAKDKLFLMDMGVL